MLLILPLLMSLVAWTPSVVFAADKTCYAFNLNPYLNFATKTAYEYAYRKSGIDKVPNCKAVQMWLLSRHGTRWPSPEDLSVFKDLYQIRDHVVSNYNNNKGTLCEEDIINLQGWSFNMPSSDNFTLTNQGRQELYLFGRRLRSYFPELLDSATYSADKYIFRHTDTSRTKESAEYFARGVFGLKFEDPSPAIPDAIPDDRLIYPYNNCPVWDKTTSAGKEERKKFYQTEYIQNVIHSVSQRLGFDYNLTIDNIKDIYDGCRYTKAWNVTGISPWCAAFIKEELEVLEYSEDLKFYHKSGPGNQMNLRLACPLAKDLVDKFSAVESQPEAAHPVGAFYFSHATMVNMLSSRIGLTEDSFPPSADNFPQEKYRQFRTSHIIPFAGNVLAVLYKCSEGEPLQTIFYLAEDIVRYPGCSVGLCEWNYVKQRFSTFVQDADCTNDKFCFDNNGAGELFGSTFSVFLALAIYRFVNFSTC